MRSWNTRSRTMIAATPRGGARLGAARVTGSGYGKNPGAYVSIPPSSPMTVGRTVGTMLWSRAATKFPMRTTARPAACSRVSEPYLTAPPTLEAGRLRDVLERVALLDPAMQHPKPTLDQLVHIGGL